MRDAHTWDLQLPLRDGGVVTACKLCGVVRRPVTETKRCAGLAAVATRHAVFVPITEAVRKLRDDMGDNVDFSISHVMSRDLRVALAWIEQNSDYIELQLSHDSA